MGDNRRSALAEDQTSDCYSLGWQERAPSPGVPISFTQENVTLLPLSPESFSDYFKFNFADSLDVGITTFNQLLDMPSTSQTQGHADVFLQPNDLPSHPHLVCSTFNEQKNHRAMERPLSRHQKFRLRKKEKEQAKDRDIQMLNQQISMKDGEIGRLRSEIEMLRNDTNEQLAHLRSEIKMLRKEIISLKHTNPPKNRRNAPISI